MPGTLTVNGHLAELPGSLLSILVSGSVASAVHVKGSASLAGTVSAAFGGTVVPTYDILTADGGRTGVFRSIAAAGLPVFMTASLAYTPTDVMIDVASRLARTPGLTSNQIAVGSGLDAAFDAGGGALAGLYPLATPQIPAALSALSGEGVSANEEAAFGADTLFLSAMGAQGDFWRNGDVVDTEGAVVPPLTAYADTAPAPPALKAVKPAAPGETPNRWRSWFSGFDGTWSLQGQSWPGAAGVGHGSGGAAAGVDRQVDPNLLLGVAAAGSHSTFNVRTLATGGALDGFEVGGYGVARSGPLDGAVTAAAGVFDTHTTRTVSGVGPTETEKGSFSSDLWSARLEAGWKREFGPFAVTPFAAIEATGLQQNGFAESASAGGLPGVLGLSNRGGWTPSVPAFLGAEFDARAALPNGLLLSSYLRLAWEHEFDPNRGVAAAFETIPSAVFAVDGPQAARNSAVVTAGLKLALKQNLSVSAVLRGDFAGREQMYAGNAGITIAF